MSGWDCCEHCEHCEHDDGYLHPLPCAEGCNDDETVAAMARQVTS